MAFTAITTGEISSGGPVTEDLLDKVRLNFDDHESRIQTLETAGEVFRPIMFTLSAPIDLSDHAPDTGALYDRVNFNITILNARLFVPNAGSSGTLEADLLFKRGASAYTSIYSTTPQLTNTDGDNALSSNEVISTTALDAGDFLRLDLTSSQVGLTEFSLIVEFEART